MNIKQGLTKLQEQFNENPTQTIAIGGLAAAGLGKLVKAIADYRNHRVWDREVERRRYNDGMRAKRRPR